MMRSTPSKLVVLHTCMRHDIIHVSTHRHVFACTSHPIVVACSEEGFDNDIRDVRCHLPYSRFSEWIIIQHAHCANAVPHGSAYISKILIIVINLLMHFARDHYTITLPLLKL